MECARRNGCETCIGSFTVVAGYGPVRALQKRTSLLEVDRGSQSEEKAAVVEEVSAQVARARRSIVVAEYRGLAVEQITVLRKQARESGVYLRVLKNTLVRRAVAGHAVRELSDQMVGPLLYGIAADPVAAAKVLAELCQGQREAGHQGGRHAEFVMDAKGVQALATMPSRDELLAKLMGTMQAPVATSFVRLNEVPSRGSCARSAAVRDQQEKQAA